MNVRGDFLGPPHGTKAVALICKVYKKAMIRNRYNQIPYPALNTKRERDTYNLDGTKIKTAQVKRQGDRSFPTDGHNASLNKLSSKSKRNRKRTNIDKSNKPQQKHRLGTVSNKLLEGLNRFTLQQPLPRFCCGSYTHRRCSVRVKDLYSSMNQNCEHINPDLSLRCNKTSTQQQTNSETLEQQKSVLPWNPHFYKV